MMDGNLLYAMACDLRSFSVAPETLLYFCRHLKGIEERTEGDLHSFVAGVRERFVARELDAREAGRLVEERVAEEFPPDLRGLSRAPQPAILRAASHHRRARRSTPLG